MQRLQSSKSSVAPFLLRTAFPTAMRTPLVVQRAFATEGDNKVFVGGLAWATDNESLKHAFSAFGEVVDARIIVDRETGRSRGFGFITYKNQTEADAAVHGMHEKELDGRQITVNKARARQPRQN